MRWVGFMVAVCSLLAFTSATSARPRTLRPRIVFFSPNSEANTYWPQVFAVIEEVAKDLDFEFVPYSFGVEDRFARGSRSISVLRGKPRPDAALASIVIGHSKPILEVAESLGIPMFLLGPLFPSELPAVGGAPRRKYASWQALFNSAEENKGYALGKALIQAARAKGAVASDGAIHVVGLGGDPSWFGSGLRQTGLARAAAEEPGVILEQVVPTKWTAAEGKALTPKLLRRYPDASVIWAASDQLGAGAVEALTALGRVPGEDVFTGGLDLSDLGLSLVAQGKFVATAASSMLSYAEAAVLVYDYLQGLDFAEQLGTEIEFQTQVATSANVAEHVRLSKCVGSIDFRRFSRAHTPGLRHYDFSSGAYLEAARTCIEQAAQSVTPSASPQMGRLP